MNPQRIRLSRAKGWRKPEGAIVVSRPSRWGNPYRIVKDSEFMGEQLYRVTAPATARPDAFLGGDYTHREAAEFAVRLYRRWITSSRARIEDLTPLLRGHDLACWCPLDQPCHADVLLELANR